VEELIESEHIIKVEFKGRTSYRNASKYFGPESASSNHESSPQQPPKDKTPEPVSYSSAVTAAIAAILCDQPTPPSQTGAVSIRRLVDRKPFFPHLYILINLFSLLHTSIASYLQSRDHGRYSRKYIDNLIEREITNSNIASIGKESYTLPPAVLKNLDNRWKFERQKIKKAANKNGGASGSAEDLNKSKTLQKKASLTPKVTPADKSPPPTPPRPERVGARMKVSKSAAVYYVKHSLLIFFTNREPRKCLIHRMWWWYQGSAVGPLEPARRIENNAVALLLLRSDLRAHSHSLDLLQIIATLILNSKLAFCASTLLSSPVE